MEKKQTVNKDNNLENRNLIYDMRIKRLTFICVVLSAIATLWYGGFYLLSENTVYFTSSWIALCSSVMFQIIIYMIEEIKHLNIKNSSSNSGTDMSDIKFNNIAFTFNIALCIGVVSLLLHTAIGYFESIIYAFFFLLIFIPSILTMVFEKRKQSKKSIFFSCLAIQIFTCFILFNSTGLYSIENISNTIKLPTPNIIWDISVSTVIQTVIMIIGFAIMIYLQLKNYKKINLIYDKQNDSTCNKKPPKI